MTNYPVQITANGKTIGLDNTKPFSETFAIPFDAIAAIVNDSENYDCGTHYIEGINETVSWRVLD